MILSLPSDNPMKQRTSATPVNLQKFNVAKWLGNAAWKPVKSSSSKYDYQEFQDSPSQFPRKCEPPELNSSSLSTGDPFVSAKNNHMEKENISEQTSIPRKASLEKSRVPQDTNGAIRTSKDDMKLPEFHAKVDKMNVQRLDVVYAKPSKHSNSFPQLCKSSTGKKAKPLPILSPIDEKNSRRRQNRIWKTTIDPKSGQTYYYDLITRQTQWHKPLELASDQERQAILMKDIEQREFFSNMEANILKCLKVGQIPGDKNQNPRNEEKNKSLVNSRIQKPKLVKTISSMDEHLLEELTKLKVSDKNIAFDKEKHARDDHYHTLKEITPLTFLNNKKDTFKSISQHDDLKNLRKNTKLELTRRNTCGTLYVGSTMSAPDIDATIKCVCALYRAHLLRSARTYSFLGSTNNSSKYDVFNDRTTDRGRGDYVHHHSEVDRSPGSRPISPIGTIILEDYMESNAESEIGFEALALETIELIVPTLDEIANFYRHILHRSQMENDCIIMSLIYVERIMHETKGGLIPNIKNWQSLLFSCMILASKVWDDLSMWNSDFSRTSPVGVSFPLKRINELEVAVLSCLNYNVEVLASEYAKYYFLLRSMLIRSGLVSDELTTTNPLNMEAAMKLEFPNSKFKELAAKDKSVPKRLQQRSKTVSLGEQVCGLDGRSDSSPKSVKLSLEHVVRM